jgi:hypothetical protein
MIAFEVKVNGKIVCTAGVGEYGGLFTDVRWSKRNLALCPTGMNEQEWVDEELALGVTGCIAHVDKTTELLRWNRKSLSIGDEIVVRILEQPECDEPEERDRYNAEEKRREERRSYYEELKKEFEGSPAEDQSD